MLQNDAAEPRLKSASTTFDCLLKLFGIRKSATREGRGGMDGKSDRQSKRERLVIELQHGSAFRSLCLMAMLDTEDPEFPGKFDHHGASSHTLTGFFFFFHQSPVRLFQGYTQLVSWITKRKRARVCVRIARLRGGSTADLKFLPVRRSGLPEEHCS